MKTIPVEQIQEAIDYLSNLDGEQMQKIIDSINEKQGFLMAYLMSAAENNFDEEERENFFYIGFIVLHLLITENSSLALIDGKFIDKVENDNMGLLELVEGKDEETVYDMVGTLLAEHKQSNLISFVLEAIYDVDEDENPFFSESDSAIMLLTLKTIIDCMDE